MTKRSPRLLFAALLCAAVSAGCGSDDPVAPNPNAAFEAEFDAYWASLDRTYAYFDYKGVDWEAARAEYRPRVAGVESRDELVSLLREMSGPLRDAQIYFVSPSGQYLRTHLGQHQLNWQSGVWRNYMRRSGWRLQQDNWGYARYRGVPYVAVSSWTADQLDLAAIQAVLEEFQDEPGLILDVRMNNAGDPEFAHRVAELFAHQETLAGWVQERTGPEPDDLGALTPRTLSARGVWPADKPVALLVGRGSFSASESFIAAMREIPNVVVMGDTTGGSSGSTATFELADGWSYLVPQRIAYTADREIIEWNGIAPDIRLNTGERGFLNGVDGVLEFAARWVATR